MYVKVTMNIIKTAKKLKSREHIACRNVNYNHCLECNLARPIKTKNTYTLTKDITSENLFHWNKNYGS